LSLLLGWVVVEVVVVVVASMVLVNGRDVAGQRAPTGLVTWRRRGRLTGVVVDAGVVDMDGRWVGRAGEVVVIDGDGRQA